MAKRKKGEGRKRQTSGMEDHRQVGRVLQPPLAQLPLAPYSWVAELLPEMLWIDAILSGVSLNRAVGIAYRALDILDAYVPADCRQVLTGMMSSFALVPEADRPDARKALGRNMLYDLVFPQDFCNALALYSQSPAHWPLEDWFKVNRIDCETGVRYLKVAVSRLWDPKSVHSTRCRMVPLARLIKHEKMVFSSSLTIVELLPRYPDGLSEDDQRRAEAECRAMFGAVTLASRRETPEWVRYFWRHSFEISACEISEEHPDGVPVGMEMIEQVIGNVEDLISRSRDLIEQAAQRIKLDIYDLHRDEVLFGLLSRQHRLFSALSSDIPLWTPDLGGMFLRAMADTLITMKWLAKKNDSMLFAKFKEFSLGRQKLLKLHVEALSDEMSGALHDWEADLAENINEEIWEELLPIDLGATFARVDMRSMAREVGLRDLYNLIFAPASAQLHGDWVSLKSFHLQHCRNPLHRFHRLPRLTGPQVLVPGVIMQAGVLFTDTLQAWLDYYGLGEFGEAAEEIVSSLRRALESLHGAEPNATQPNGS